MSYQITANGFLAHHFHGEYWCSVGLEFENEEAASDALMKLGEGWTIGEQHKNVLVWHGNSKALDVLKERFKGDGFKLTIKPCKWSDCRNHCRDAEIDSCNHSIDYGPPFELTITVEVVDQN